MGIGDVPGISILRVTKLDDAVLVVVRCNLQSQRPSLRETTTTAGETTTTAAPPPTTTAA